MTDFTPEDQAVLDMLMDVHTDPHRPLDGADYMDMVEVDPTGDLGLVWAPRIRTWDEASTPWPATQAWMEPGPCKCKYPHGYRPQCQRCMVEYMAKGRRTWIEGQDGDRWVWDGNGEYGAHHQTSEVGGFRAHVVHYPTHGPRHLGTWIIVVTEYLFEKPVTFKRGGKEITYTMRARDVIGYEEVVDYNEGYYRAQELVEQWRATRDYEQNGWSVVDPGEALPPMGAAVVSPEFLDHLADTRNGEVIA